MFASPRSSPLVRTRTAGGGGIPGESPATPAPSPGFFTVAPGVFGGSLSTGTPGGTPSSDSGFTPGTIDPFDKPFPGTTASPPPSEAAPFTPPGAPPPDATPPPLESRPYVNTLGVGGVSALKAKLGVVARAYPSLATTASYPLGYPLPSDAGDGVDARFLQTVQAFQRWANLQAARGSSSDAIQAATFSLNEDGVLDKATAGRLGFWYEEALKSPTATNTTPRTDAGPRATTATTPTASSPAAAIAAGVSAPETKVAGGGLFLVLVGGLVALGIAAGRK